MSDTAAAPGRLAGREPTEAYRRAVLYVERVYDLCAEPGRRAALRSGVGRPLDRCPRMHAVIAAHVPAHFSESRQRAHYAVAAMIASLPPSARRGAAQGATATACSTPRNLGWCLAEGVEAGRLRESTAESRLSLLTRQSVNGLHRHLPATVRLLASRPDDIDFAQLLLDVSWWDRDRHRIGRRWMQSYYRTRMRAQESAAVRADDEAQQAL